jgi:putative chitinase
MNEEEIEALIDEEEAGSKGQLSFDDEVDDIMSEVMGGLDPFDENIDEDKYEDLSLGAKVGEVVGSGLERGVENTGNVLTSIPGMLKGAYESFTKEDGFMHQMPEAIGDVVTYPYDKVMNPERAAEFEGDFSAGVGVLKENKEEIADAVGKGGSQLAPVIAFGPAGVLASPLTGAAWNLYSDLIGLADGEAGSDLELDKSGWQHLEDALAESTPEMIFTALGGAVNTVANKTDDVGDWFHKRVKETEKLKTPNTRARKIFSQGASTMDADALNNAVENIGDEIRGRMAAHGRMATDDVGEHMTRILKGKLSKSKGGMADGSVTGVRSGGMIDELKGQVHNAISQSKLKVGIADDIDGFLDDAFAPVSSLDDAQVRNARVLSKEAFERKAYEKASGLTGKESAKGVGRVRGRRKRLEANHKELNALNEARDKSGLSSEGLRRRDYLRRQIDTDEALLKQYDNTINSVKLNSNEFFDAVRDATKEVNFDGQLTNKKWKVLELMRNNAKDWLKAEMSDEALKAAYDKVNTRYWSAETLGEFSQKLIIKDMRRAKEPRTLVQALRKIWRDIGFANEGPKVDLVDEWDAMVKLHGAPEKVGKGGLTSRFLRGFFTPLGKPLRTSAEFFSPQYVAILDGIVNDLEQLDEVGGLSPEEQESAAQAVDDLMAAADAARQGVGKGEAEQKALVADLQANSPSAAVFAPKPKQSLEGSPHLAGVKLMGDQPLTEKDEARYKLNLKRDNSLSNVERGKLIRHLNRHGRIKLPVQTKPAISSQERAEIEQETSAALAREELRKLRTSKDVSKRGQMGSIMKMDERKEVDFTPEEAESALMNAAISEGISDAAEMAQFLGQLSHESAGFSTLVERGSGKKYEGRKVLGNTKPGDGERFKGRGFIQLTGRYNYDKYGDMIGEDLIANPELAADPDVAARIAVAYWKDRVRGRVKDFKNTKAVTKAINGGYNGLRDRERRVKQFMEKESAMDAFGLKLA